jgi:hypothetical protein
MEVSATITITRHPLWEDIKFEVDVEGVYSAAERRTRNYPGSDAEVEITSTTVKGQPFILNADEMKEAEAALFEAAKDAIEDAAVSRYESWLSKVW